MQRQTSIPFYPPINSPPPRLRDFEQCFAQSLQLSCGVAFELYDVIHGGEFNNGDCGCESRIKQETTPPATSLCRDGKCKRAYCNATNFLTLDQNCRNQMTFLKLNERKRERSHKDYGRVAIISEDKHGGLVNFSKKLGDNESELDPMVV